MVRRSLSETAWVHCIQEFHLCFQIKCFLKVQASTREASDIIQSKGTRASASWLGEKLLPILDLVFNQGRSGKAIFSKRITID